MLSALQAGMVKDSLRDKQATDFRQKDNRNSLAGYRK
jgi:hypothetical protein